MATHRIARSTTLDLEDATGENTKAKALDEAGRAYLRLVGRNMVEPGPGLLHELLEAAEERGGLDAAEIAEILRRGTAVAVRAGGVVGRRRTVTLQVFRPVPLPDFPRRCFDSGGRHTVRWTTSSVAPPTQPGSVGTYPSRLSFLLRD